MKQTIAIPFTVSNSTGVQTMNRVSVPAVPWIDGPTIPRDPRHETAPRRDVITPQHRITPDDFIAALRLECVRARKEGMA